MVAPTEIPTGVGEGGGVTPPDAPAPPSLAERLALSADERAALPDELRTVTLDDLDSVLVEREQQAAERERETFRRQQAAQAAAEQARRQRDATAQQDIDFYQNLDARLNSDDETVRASALLEYQKPENKNRYIDGAALLRTESQQAQQREALTTLFIAGHRELDAAGMGNAVPAPGTPEFYGFVEQVNTAKGGLFGYLIDYGKRLGADEALARGREEGARIERIERGANGAPQMSAGGSGSREDYGNADWVRQKMSDPAWGLQMSPDGRHTNNARIRQAIAAQRRAG